MKNLSVSLLMVGLLKILTAFAAIVLMVRKKIHLGTAMLSGAVILAILSGGGCLLFRSGNAISPGDFLSVIWREASSPSTLKLIGVVVLVLILSHCLEKTGQMNQLLRSFQSLVGDARIVMMALPALIGLLPMPGGAVFSAPMVEEAQKEINLPPTSKTLINYWFRHLWEYSWPLYPGLLLAAELAKRSGLNLSVFELAAIQSPLTAAAIAGGIIFILRKVPRAIPAATGKERNIPIAGMAVNLSPIVAIIGMVVLLYGAVGMESKDSLLVALVAAIILALTISALQKRSPPLLALRSIPMEGMLKLIYVIVGLMIFRGTIERSGAVTEISDMMKLYDLPLFPLIVLLSFVCGLVTGLTMAYIGIVFTTLSPLLVQVTTDPLPFLVLAFGSGFIGVLFSPVHVCLILTHQYFTSDFPSVYRGMIGPVAVVFATLLLLFSALRLTPLSG